MLDEPLKKVIAFLDQNEYKIPGWAITVEIITIIIAKRS